MTELEEAVLEVVDTREVRPRSVRMTLQAFGYDGDSVRSAIARLLDAGKLRLTSDLKVAAK